MSPGIIALFTCYKCPDPCSRCSSPRCKITGDPAQMREAAASGPAVTQSCSMKSLETGGRFSLSPLACFHRVTCAFLTLELSAQIPCFSLTFEIFFISGLNTLSAGENVLLTVHGTSLAHVCAHILYIIYTVPPHTAHFYTSLLVLIYSDGIN